MSEEEKVEQEEVEEQVEETSAEDVKTENKEEKTQPDNSIPYERFQQVIEEKNEWKNKYNNAMQKIEELKGSENVIEELKKEKEQIENRHLQERKEYDLRTKALAEGVRKEALDDIVKVVDLSKLTIKDDDVIGTEDVIKDLKENKPYYFPTEEKKETKAGNDFREGIDKDEKRDLKKYFGIQT